MAKDILVVPDPHAHPEFHNKRADWLGQLILDLKPEVVINLGDTFDMPSLSSYDKGKASFNGASYEKDINSGLDFLDRMWHPTKKRKKKKPLSVFLEGNHEHRLRRVLETTPEMEGANFGYSYSNYKLADYHQEIVYYQGGTPGQYHHSGFSFAHFFPSGLMGKPIGGEHHASSLIAKNHSSSVCGHSHTVDFAVRHTSTGKEIMGIVAGVYQDYETTWAGVVNQLWWRGLVHLRGAEGGAASPEFISLSRLRREYG